MTTTIKKKICLLGETSVGKTSLVSQYISSIFSENYLTTVGVKISKKKLQFDSINTELIIWDIAGGSDAKTFFKSYLKGSSGFLIVVDSTRHQTFEYALKQLEFLKATYDNPELIFLLNKSDLKEENKIKQEELDYLTKENVNFLFTSAKLDIGVDEAFINITKNMIDKK